MKKLLLLAFACTVIGCAKHNDSNTTTDTTNSMTSPAAAPAPTPTPVPMDTTYRDTMRH